jgi:hypothetical protein
MKHSVDRKYLLPILLNLVLILVLLTGCNASATQSAPTQPAAVQPTETARPTDTSIPPTNTPVPPTNTSVPPTSTPVPPTNTPVPPTPTVDMEAAMKSAKILVFEDMVFDPYIKTALDKAGYKTTYVADRMGSFKKEIQSDTKWDLVIAAAEGRGGVQGEFFDYIKQQLDGGASVIMEMWTLDTNAKGRFAPVLEECGIQFQANWINPSNRGVFWTDASHPLANEPNQLSLTHFTNYWVGDLGDLVSKTPGSKAQIVASANAGNPEKDGLITVCYDGRLILQTFSTHDHAAADAVKLWQNYVYFALKTRIQNGQK